MNNYLPESTEINHVRQILKGLADQSYKLSMGLQGLSPAQSGGTSTRVHYLLEVSLYLDKISRSIDEFGRVDQSMNDKEPDLS